MSHARRAEVTDSAPTSPGADDATPPERRRHHDRHREGQYLTEADLRAADEAIWNADPSIPESESR